MVKKGYRVVAAPTEGLANMPMHAVGTLATTDSEILGIGYLGVEVTYTLTEKQTDTQTETKSLKGNVQYVPTQAYQQICTEYSQLSDSSSLCSSTGWETSPKLSPMCNGPDRDNSKGTAQGRNMPFLSPIMAKNPMTRCKLGSASSDSMSFDCESFDTAWSEISEQDSCLSVFNSEYSAEVEGVGNAIDTDTTEEFDESLETPFTDMDTENLGFTPGEVQVADFSTGSDVVNKENKNRIIKVRTMNDLNNEKYYVRGQNAESLSSVLGNVFENDLEGKENYYEYKESNTDRLCQNDYENEIEKENIVNSNKRGYRNGTSSINRILDIQKYVIQKENIYNENYNNMKWHVKCFECKTTNRNSQLDLSAASPENVPRYPLDDFYKKRQNVTSKKNRKIASLILCGCAQGNAKSPKKHNRRTKCAKKTDGRFLTLGFSWKK